MKIDIAQLEFIEKSLREILFWTEIETGLEFTITSLYRIGDDGVHGQLPLRGTDLRIRCESVGKGIEKLINQKWRYDPSRPEKKCAFLHGEGANLHLHIQVHPNTIRAS
jgi:hypothetical protein